jgi:hypothetical protein
VTWGLWKLRNEEFHNLYSSPSIIILMKSRKMKLSGHVERREARWNSCTILVGKPEGKRPVGRPRRK